MLTIDFLEFLRGGLRILGLVHEVQALIVELVGGLLDEGVVLGAELVPDRAGAAATQRHGQHDEARRQPHMAAEAGEQGVTGFERNALCRHISET